jgi:hypothetical protein
VFIATTPLLVVVVVVVGVVVPTSSTGDDGPAMPSFFSTCDVCVDVMS